MSSGSSWAFYKRGPSILSDAVKAARSTLANPSIDYPVIVCIQADIPGNAYWDDIVDHFNQMRCCLLIIDILQGGDTLDHFKGAAMGASGAQPVPSYEEVAKIVNEVLGIPHWGPCRE